MSEVHGTRRPVRASWTASVVVDDEVVIYNERTGDLHVLNQTAGMLWTLFDGSADLRELSEDLADAFEVDVAMVREQVEDATRELASLGLLAGDEDGTAEPDAVRGGPAYLVDPPNG